MHCWTSQKTRCSNRVRRSIYPRKAVVTNWVARGQARVRGQAHAPRTSRATGRQPDWYHSDQKTRMNDHLRSNTAIIRNCDSADEDARQKHLSYALACECLVGADAGREDIANVKRAPARRTAPTIRWLRLRDFGFTFLRPSIDRSLARERCRVHTQAVIMSRWGNVGFL